MHAFEVTFIQIWSASEIDMETTVYIDSESHELKSIPVSFINNFISVSKNSAVSFFFNGISNGGGENRLYSPIFLKPIRLKHLLINIVGREEYHILLARLHVPSGTFVAGVRVAVIHEEVKSGFTSRNL